MIYFSSFRNIDFKWILHLGILICTSNKNEQPKLGIFDLAKNSSTKYMNSKETMRINNAT